MKSRKIIFAILLIIWMITIFAFSNQVSEESSGTSGKTIRAILSFFPSFKQMEEIKQEQLVEFLQPIARKLAHFTIYSLGGIIIALNINEYTLTEKKKVLLSCMAGFVYSVTDEIHQMFIPGRAGMVIDVVIDSVGVVLGVALVWVVIEIMNRRKLHE